MSRYYDRQGHPIDRSVWAGSFSDFTLKRVGYTELPDGKCISTVWLGLDHQHGDGPPLIFETMVFPGDGEFNELDCERYSTEAEAIAGHQQMVERWTKGGHDK